VAWSVLQSASTAPVNPIPGTTVTVTYGTNLSSGSKLIAWVTISSSSTNDAVSVKDGSGNSFTQVGLTLASGLNQMSVWVLDTPAGDVGTKPVITLTVGHSGADAGGILVQEVSGLISGTTPFDGTYGSVTGASGTSTGNPSYSSTAANEYLVSFYGDNGGGGGSAITAPSGYTTDSSTVSGNNPGDIGIAYTNSSNGAETGGWTRTNTGAQWGVILVAFKLAAGGGGQPGTVQPRAAVPAPRRRPARASWRGGGGQAYAAVAAPRQQYRLAPRRLPGRAVVRFIPVVTVNAAAVTGVAGTVPALMVNQTRTAIRRDGRVVRH
jgi:hypothetical protein